MSDFSRVAREQREKKKQEATLARESQRMQLAECRCSFNQFNPIVRRLLMDVGAAVYGRALPGFRRYTVESHYLDRRGYSRTPTLGGIAGYWQLRRGWLIPSISNSLTLEVCLSAPDNSGTGTFYIKAGRWTFTGIGHNASTQCVGTEADLKKALSQMTVALVEMNAGRLSF
jgi:hypothetical protein